MNLVSAWQNFYVIVGSSAGALIGLQFVVIALIASLRSGTDAESIDAFGTPQVVHFGGALAVSAIMSAPWPSLAGLSVVLTLCGLGGLAYIVIVFRRAFRQKAYKPVLEDWLWHAIFPCGIHAAITSGAILLRAVPLSALFVIGTATLGLLFVGIRNAWDSVTWLVAGQDSNAKSQ